MPGTKTLSAGYSETGCTVYGIVRRDSDSYRLNDATGAFASNPADPYLSLVEDSTIKGLYEVAENRTVWLDGSYTIVAYRQAGVAPVPSVDSPIGIGAITIEDDAIDTISTTNITGAVWDGGLTDYTSIGTFGLLCNAVKSQYGL